MALYRVVEFAPGCSLEPIPAEYTDARALLCIAGADVDIDGGIPLSDVELRHLRDAIDEALDRSF